MTYLIILITAIISIRLFSRRDLFYKLSFSPYSIKHSKEYKRFITHVFVHADFPHLIFNMLTLFFFGPNLEVFFKSEFGNMGYVLFFILYFGAATTSSLFSYKKYSDNVMYNAVGASGAVAAVLFAFILFEPWSKIYVFIIPIGIPAFIFGGLYLAYSFYMDKRGNDNIGHDAHFWGAVYGFSFPIFFNPSIFIHFINQIIN